jgi:hypothetical protein
MVRIVSRRRYGLKGTSHVNHTVEGSDEQRCSLIAHFAQLHQQVHELLILYNGSLAKLDRNNVVEHARVFVARALFNLMNEM